VQINEKKLRRLSCINSGQCHRRIFITKISGGISSLRRWKLLWYFFLICCSCTGSSNRTDSLVECTLCGVSLGICYVAVFRGPSGSCLAGRTSSGPQWNSFLSFFSWVYLIAMGCHFRSSPETGRADKKESLRENVIKFEVARIFPGSPIPHPRTRIQ
jgi:hypothetical protein